MDKVKIKGTKKIQIIPNKTKQIFDFWLIFYILYAFLPLTILEFQQWILISDQFQQSIIIYCNKSSMDIQESFPPIQYKNPSSIKVNKPANYLKLESYGRQFYDENKPLSYEGPLWPNECILSVPNMFIINKSQVNSYDTYLIKYFQYLEEDHQKHQIKRRLEELFQNILPPLIREASTEFTMECFIYLLQTRYLDCSRQYHKNKKVSYAHRDFLSYLFGSHSLYPHYYTEKFSPFHQYIYNSLNSQNFNIKMFSHALQQLINNNEFQAFLNHQNAPEEIFEQYKKLCHELLVKKTIIPMISFIFKSGLIPLSLFFRHNRSPNAKWILDSNKTAILLAAKKAFFHKELMVCYNPQLTIQEGFVAYGLFFQQAMCEVRFEVYPDFEMDPLVLRYALTENKQRQFVKSIVQQLLNQTFYIKSQDLNRIAESWRVEQARKQMSYKQLKEYVFRQGGRIYQEQKKNMESLGSIIMAELELIDLLIRHEKDIFDTFRRLKRQIRLLQ